MAGDGVCGECGSEEEEGEGEDGEVK